MSPHVVPRVAKPLRRLSASPDSAQYLMSLSLASSNVQSKRIPCQNEWKPCVRQVVDQNLFLKRATCTIPNTIMFKGSNDYSFLLKLDCIGYCTSGNPTFIGREPTRIRQERSHSERLGVAAVTFPISRATAYRHACRNRPKSPPRRPVSQPKTL